MTVDFDYLWRGDGELIVYLSNSPKVSVCPNDGEFEDCHTEIGRLTPPPSGRPGSIGDTRFSRFAVTFPVDLPSLPDFTRGVYIELELRGPEGCIWIDNWDPFIACTLTCLDLNGDSVVSGGDFLLHLAETGSPVSTGRSCLDAPFSTDQYVDIEDVLAIEAMLSADPPPLNYCEPPEPGPALGTPIPPEALPTGQMLIAGKPHGTTGRSLQADQLYAFDGETLGSPLSPASGGPPHGNSRLYKDPEGILYQLHATQGLIRLDTAEREIGPFHDTINQTGIEQEVFVGVLDTYDIWDYALDGYPQGLPLLDVVFDDAEPGVVYVAPVVVESTAYCPSYYDDCPFYKATARIVLQPDNQHLITQVYGVEPALDELCSYAQPPGASGCQIQDQCEIELDADGHLLVLSASARSESNNWLVVYDANSGTELARISLSDIDEGLANPATMLASRYSPGCIYLTSELDADPFDDVLILYRCRLDLGTPTSPLVVEAAIPVQCGEDVLPVGMGFGHLLMATTAIESPVDGTVHLLGMAMARVATDLSQDDPLYDELYCDDCELTANAWQAIVPADSSGPINATLLQGQDLALPLSAVFINAACAAPGSGDFDGDGLSTADIPHMTEALLDPAPTEEMICTGDMNADGQLDGADIQLFVNALLGD